MGQYGYSSWTLHMASIIIFGTIWGFAFREWKDAAVRVKATGVGRRRAARLRDDGDRLWQQPGFVR